MNLFNWFKQPKPVPVQVVRLTPDVYRALERQVSPSIVTPASAESAAYQLGIQRVLQAVRVGITLGHSE